MPSVKRFARYADELEHLVRELNDEEKIVGYKGQIDRALNGEPAARLRAIASIELLRRSGAFFTGPNLASQLVASLKSQLAIGTTVSDFACGTGNLLTACANYLPLFGDVQETVAMWGRYLSGGDIHEEFVRVTKARLALVAIARGAQPAPIECNDTFPRIRTADAFEQGEMIANSDCITLNPPFTVTIAPAGCSWASGNVSTAALMVENCVRSAKEGTKIVAILPEVLRTGSHYERWRHVIEESAIIESVEVVGLFDDRTDVDVFILRLHVSTNGARLSGDWWRSCDTNSPSKTIGDLFDVRVGPVVPHRDLHEGSWHPFVTAHDLPTWTSVNTDNDFPRRRFTGTTYSPPFLLVRRTSRPEDKNRAVTTLARGKRPVAVENHLLVLKPKDGLLRSCQHAIQRLRSHETSVWLNERIRCRHLTVSSVAEIPLWK